MPRPAQSGWHWRIWAAEGAGTGLMMLGGLSAVCLTFGQGSFFAEALPSDSVRRLVVGALFAACVSLVAVSPLGRLSGAHLNPAVTVSFRVLGRVSGHDVGGYLVAQLAGALTGTALGWVVWGSTARSVVFGQTADTRLATARRCQRCRSASATRIRTCPLPDLHGTLKRG
jgi:aquaporin Z